MFGRALHDYVLIRPNYPEATVRVDVSELDRLCANATSGDPFLTLAQMVVQGDVACYCMQPLVPALAETFARFLNKTGPGNMGGPAAADRELMEFCARSARAFTATFNELTAHGHYRSNGRNNQNGPAGSAVSIELFKMMRQANCFSDRVLDHHLGSIVADFGPVFLSDDIQQIPQDLDAVIHEVVVSLGDSTGSASFNVIVVAFRQYLDHVVGQVSTLDRAGLVEMVHATLNVMERTASKVESKVELADFILKVIPDTFAAFGTCLCALAACMGWCRCCNIEFFLKSLWYSQFLESHMPARVHRKRAPQKSDTNTSVARTVGGCQCQPVPIRGCSPTMLS
jgi:hypothetical protein